MKKLFIIILILICLLLQGCSQSAKMRETYPHITLEISSYYADDVYISLPQGYTFNPKCYYDEIETKEGYDIIIHLKKELIGK